MAKLTTLINKAYKTLADSNGIPDELKQNFIYVFNELINQSGGLRNAILAFGRNEIPDDIRSYAEKLDVASLFNKPASIVEVYDQLNKENFKENIQSIFKQYDQIYGQSGTASEDKIKLALFSLILASANKIDKDLPSGNLINAPTENELKIDEHDDGYQLRITAATGIQPQDLKYVLHDGEEIFQIDNNGLLTLKNTALNYDEAGSGSNSYSVLLSVENVKTGASTIKELNFNIQDKQWIFSLDNAGNLTEAPKGGILTLNIKTDQQIVGAKEIMLTLAFDNKALIDPDSFDGMQYDPDTGKLTLKVQGPFSQDAIVASLSIKTINNATSNPTDKLTVTLEAASISGYDEQDVRVGEADSILFSIQIDDIPGFTLEQLANSALPELTLGEVLEGTEARYRIILSNAGIQAGTTVVLDLSTSDGSAHYANDYGDIVSLESSVGEASYTNGKLTLVLSDDAEIGQVLASFSVPINLNDSGEAIEDFSVNLSGAEVMGITVPANSSLTTYIIDNPLVNPFVVVGPAVNTIEGDLMRFTVSRTDSELAADVYVSTRNGSAEAGQDYTGLSQQLVHFEPGQTERVVDVATLLDTQLENQETFWLNLYATLDDAMAGRNLLASAEGTIEDSKGTIKNSIKLISTGAKGQGDGSSYAPAISADGRYVAFVSDATNLVKDKDTNGAMNIFLHDTETGKTELVSTGKDGLGGNNDSHAPVISANGRYVAFVSDATNLVKDKDTNGAMNIFLHDTETGKTELVSTGKDGLGGNDDSHAPVISANGRYVAFASYATDLEGDTNAALNIFLYDAETGKTELVSTGVNGQEDDISVTPAISGDGRYVAFESYADNPMEGDTNDAIDIYLYNIETKHTTWVSTGVDGLENRNSYSPAISDDGRYVAFASYADDPNGTIDIFLHDTKTKRTTRVATGVHDQKDNDSHPLAISGDGRYVAFASYATDLEGDTNGVMNIFRHDPETGDTTLVFTWMNGQSGAPAISDDGRYVAFMSDADDLIGEDSNGALSDIFRVDISLVGLLTLENS
jgi:Tol biopolymer transport system component